MFCILTCSRRLRIHFGSNIRFMQWYLFFKNMHLNTSLNLDFFDTILKPCYGTETSNLQWRLNKSFCILTVLKLEPFINWHLTLAVKYTFGYRVVGCLHYHCLFLLVNDWEYKCKIENESFHCDLYWLSTIHLPRPNQPRHVRMVSTIHLHWL